MQFTPITPTIPAGISSTAGKPSMATSLKSDSERTLRILCVTSHSPEGEDYGARLRARHMFRLLDQLAEVSVVVAGLYHAYIPDPAPRQGVLKPAAVIPFCDWPIGYGMGRLQYEFSSSNMNLYGVGADIQDCRMFHEMASRHDVVWFFGLRVANGLRQWRWPNSILDVDDIPSQFYRYVAFAKHGWRIKERVEALHHIRVWRRHELRIFERFDTVGVCSLQDHKYFKNDERVFVLPNGFDVPKGMPVSAPSDPLRIGFIGRLDYPPNLNGLRWFIREAWPAIRRRAPGVVLRVLGATRNTNEFADMPGVEGLGWVEDSDAEMATWACTVVPIFEGGGTRLKISHAWSRKCPVVSTALGAFGYDPLHNRELLLADTAADFATACLKLIDNPSEGRRLADNAYEAFLSRWTWEANLPTLKRQLQATLARGGASRNVIFKDGTAVAPATDTVDRGMTR